MNVGQAKALARRWAAEEAGRLPGFDGALYAGSVNWLPDDAELPPVSDIDIWMVVAGSDESRVSGKLRHRDVILDIVYVPGGLLRSPERILGDYHMAGMFRTPNVILDPSGWLTGLQAAVSRGYARRPWVQQRCGQARDKVLRYIRSLNESEPLHDQVTAWLFATGVLTHVLLAAGLKNPTVRRRYVAAHELLAEYGRLDFYETLLEVLGCARMSRDRAKHHLDALVGAFDAATAAIRTPFPFSSDISDVARPIAIDGSRDLIEAGCHREAVFWIVATHARCEKVLHDDAPAEVRERHARTFRELLGDLGIESSAGLRRRAEEVAELLPRVWTVAEEIMSANPGIEE